MDMVEVHAKPMLLFMSVLLEPHSFSRVCTPIAAPGPVTVVISQVTSTASSLAEVLLFLTLQWNSGHQILTLLFTIAVPLAGLWFLPLPGPQAHPRVQLPVWHALLCRTRGGGVLHGLPCV